MQSQTLPEVAKLSGCCRIRHVDAAALAEALTALHIRNRPGVHIVFHSTESIA